MLKIKNINSNSLQRKRIFHAHHVSKQYAKETHVHRDAQVISQCPEVEIDLSQSSTYKSNHNNVVWFPFTFQLHNYLSSRKSALKRKKER